MKNKVLGTLYYIFWVLLIVQIPAVMDGEYAIPVSAATLFIYMGVCYCGGIYDDCWFMLRYACAILITCGLVAAIVCGPDIYVLCILAFQLLLYYNTDGGVQNEEYKSYQVSIPEGDPDSLLEQDDSTGRDL